MTTRINRRAFVAASAAAIAWPMTTASAHRSRRAKPFRISLAQWSLHRAIRAGEIDPLDFPAIARERYGVDAVELVNSFYKGRPRDAEYLHELRTRADDAGVRILLIMCDGVGALGDPDSERRGRAVDGHVRWLEAASALGCHTIRVNAQSEGGFEEQQKLAANGLRRLSTLASGYGLNVAVENHGGLSSNGAWLAGVMRLVDLPNCGTLPDFGNFCMDWSRADDPEAWYDRYRGVEELMPFAKAVSAKSHAFDGAGNETGTDFARMMKIVLDAGYNGHVGIEYEGTAHSEHEGILKTKALLERVRDQL